MGGTAKTALLTKRDRAPIKAIKPQLHRNGLYFIGIDVIDGTLIEINVTSPAGIPKINKLSGTRLESQVVDFLESRVSGR